jgi:hypothetical protein
VRASHIEADSRNHLHVCVLFFMLFLVIFDGLERTRAIGSSQLNVTFHITGSLL